MNKIVLYSVLVGLGLIVAVVLFALPEAVEREVSVVEAEAVVDKGTCVIQPKKAGRKLLEPMHANNTELSFETGPQCNILPRLKQGSIVMYRSPRGPDPITLKVAGLPGDDIVTGAGNILMINGQNFNNSNGQGYRLGAREQKTVMNKIKADHGGKIPAGSYFLMGDNDRIYLDSSRFGLAKGSDILGILAE